MKKSLAHFEKARKVLPGGVNSSTRFSRAFGSLFYVKRTSGSRVWDIDGNEYIDMCCAHGAALLGHGHPAIDSALKTAGELG